MALKKSDLYSSLWASCDALRGGMDASQYKDYVLVLLFVKYVSDKYAGDAHSVIFVPEGGSFADMVRLKGDKDIGNQMNIIIGRLAEENDLVGVIDVADFNDEDKLGKGKELVDRLSNLIAIFEKPELNFSKNRAEGDDILGDAYEYLMRHFATESGKSKGQFYTPAEVSRVLAKVLGIAGSTNSTTFYDPTCGSGSLLLKTLDEAEGKGTIYGQEKETATAALARMNMILHGQATADIKRGYSTLSNPAFTEKDGSLKRFDYIVANPPFSLKNWTTGFNPAEDHFERFADGLIPPEKNGDFAFLLHIVASLKSTGKAACILPHGVLFRGNAESDIRKRLIQRGYVKAIIGLPANLFYGTGIPACVIVLDKDCAELRDSIFFIDASKGFIKDGNKNRLREQDIHKIVDVFEKLMQIPGYSRLVPKSEIADPKNDYNLNIPRYIESTEVEDIQNIEAHLKGGIPSGDLQTLESYWQVCPNLQKALFAQERTGFSKLLVPKDQIKNTIYHDAEFLAFRNRVQAVFEAWKLKSSEQLALMYRGIRPKEWIADLSESLLNAYRPLPLVDAYDVYQHLLDYWAEVMQDDFYLIAAEGWKAEPYRVTVVSKSGKNKGQEVDKGWACDLVPKDLLKKVRFATESEALDQMQSDLDATSSKLDELEEEHSGEEGLLAEVEKVNAAEIKKRLKAIDTKVLCKDNAEEIALLKELQELMNRQAELKKQIATREAELDLALLASYKTLSEADVIDLVIHHKWMPALESKMSSEMERLSQKLTTRIKELAERYESKLPELVQQTAELESKFFENLAKMGYVV